MYRTGHWEPTSFLGFKGSYWSTSNNDQHQVSKADSHSQGECSGLKLALGEPVGWLKMINTVPEFTCLCLKISHILVLESY